MESDRVRLSPRVSHLLMYPFILPLGDGEAIRAISIMIIADYYESSYIIACRGMPSYIHRMP